MSDERYTNPAAPPSKAYDDLVANLKKDIMLSDLAGQINGTTQIAAGTLQPQIF